MVGKVHFSRRDFLKVMGLLSSSMAVPGILPPHLLRESGQNPLRTQQNQTLTSIADYYLEWMERPYQAPLNDLFFETMEDKTVAFVLYDLTHHDLIAALRSEVAMPIASAFKGPVLIYFIHQIDASVWGSVPVEYWMARDEDELPAEYQAAWKEHQAILRDLHQMIVISDNNAAGRVMAYVAAAQGNNNPMALFNDWSHNVVGVSQLSAMSSWSSGVPGYMESIDERYIEREVNFEYKLIPYENLMTARDLGLYYAWMLTYLTPEQLTVCEAMLSVIQDERRGNVERLAFQNAGVAYSKNGALAADETPFGTVITDAGIAGTGEETTYIVVMLSMDADAQVPNIFFVADETIKGVHDQAIADFKLALANEVDMAHFSEQHLAAAYGAGVLATSADGFNYGFVKHEGVSIYSQPDEEHPLRNPVIGNTRFGVHLLMQGALVRFEVLDDTWAHLIPDSPTDNVRKRLGTEIFVKLSDLHPIALDYARPLDYLVDSSIAQTEKFVVIDLVQRNLTAFEKGQVVLKVPIILNQYATPRGSYVITTKWFARSMQPWAPGVPFTSFFHNEGFALHGSPWQRWETTVNETNITKRTSAGCINIPNWMVTVGEHNRPADELLFRWLGGMREPNSNVFEYTNQEYPAVRIFVVDYLRDLTQYRLPDGALSADMNWTRIIEAIEQATVTAPPAFFASAMDG